LVDDHGTAFHIDENDHLYISGELEAQNVDFDPSSGQLLLSQNNATAFLAKFDLNFNVKWAYTLSGAAFVKIEDIECDKTGNVFIGGKVYGNNIDFNPQAGVNSITTAGFYDAFLAKYDSLSNYQWAFNIGGASQEFIGGIELDDSANVYVEGYLRSSNVDFDPSVSTKLLSPNGIEDAFVAKYSSSSNLRWAFNVGHKFITNFKDIILQKNNLYLVGGFSGKDTLDLDPGPGVNKIIYQDTVLGSQFLVNYNINGGFNNCFSLHPRIGITSFDVDSLNSIYLTGNFLGNPLNFGGGSTTYNLTSGWGWDFFIAKYQNTGTLNWAFNIGALQNANYDLICYDIEVDDSLNIYVTGSAACDTVDFDPSSNTAYETGPITGKMFVAKYSQNLFAGIMENKSNAKKDLTVFPNPASSEVFIKSNYSGEFSLLNSEGKKVTELILNSSQITRMETKNIRPGIYYLLSKQNPGISCKIVVAE